MAWYPQFIFRESGDPVPLNVDSLNPGATPVNASYMNNRDVEITAIEHALGTNLVSPASASESLTKYLKIRGYGDPVYFYRLTFVGPNGLDGVYFDVDSNGTLRMYNTLQNGSIAVDPHDYLYLGTSQSDEIQIGRTDAIIRTTVRGRFIFDVKSSAPDWTLDIANGRIGFWLDENVNPPQLKVRFKRSTGEQYEAIVNLTLV